MLRVSNFVLLFSPLIIALLKECILEKEIYLIKILFIIMKFREIVNQYNRLQKASNKSFRQTIEVSIQRVNRNSMLIKFPLYHKSNNLQRSEENSTRWIFNERAIIRW